MSYIIPSRFIGGEMFQDENGGYNNSGHDERYDGEYNERTGSANNQVYDKSEQNVDVWIGSMPLMTEGIVVSMIKG